MGKQHVDSLNISFQANLLYTVMKHRGNTVEKEKKDHQKTMITVQT